MPVVFKSNRYRKRSQENGSHLSDLRVKIYNENLIRIILAAHKGNTRFLMVAVVRDLPEGIPSGSL